MTSVPGKLTIDSDGRLRGPASIQYNSPWPCVNGSWGSGTMSGVLMHTMVGNLPGTIAVFNEAGFDASAHFGIAQDGQIRQFGPIGKGWIAWHAMAANQTWYGIEHADGGNPDNPLTPEQIAASAQVVECLSAFAGFPLTEANTPDERGYGVHYMGGEAWGGHTCPDLPPAHVRSRQRPAILALATEIRAGAVPPSPDPAPAFSQEDSVIQLDSSQAFHSLLLPEGTGSFQLDCAVPEEVAPVKIQVSRFDDAAGAVTKELSWAAGYADFPVEPGQLHWRVVVVSGGGPMVTVRFWPRSTS